MSDTENVSPLEKKIIRQIEYYFGDFNLPRDKFLSEETKADSGWVSMDTMLKFKRLLELSNDAAAIVTALKKSKAGLMEVAEDNSKIRRNPEIPLPENTVESKALLEARTVYVKGFDQESTTLDELLDFFNDTNTNVVSIQMRNYSVGKGKDKEWKFKGSIFITFKTSDAAAEFVNNKEWTYKDKEMIMKFQKNYLEDKAREYEEKKKGKGKGGKKESEPAKQEEKEEELQLARGAVLKLTGLGGDVTREDIKEVLKDKFDVNIDKGEDRILIFWTKCSIIYFLTDGGDVAFITYEKGEAEAKIRFKTENFAKPIAEKWVGLESVEIKELKVVGSLLEVRQLRTVFLLLTQMSSSYRRKFISTARHKPNLYPRLC